MAIKQESGVSNEARRVIYDLPQMPYLSESRIDRFLAKVVAMGEDPVWHAKRLRGFGGSEAGALLRHAFGVFFDAPGDSFKPAEQVVSEKLLSQLPMYPTDQAVRGTDIEALTQAVFRRKHKLAPCIHGFEATRQHKTIEPMVGNIDDAVVLNRKKILIDYKSSQDPYKDKPFDYVAQINTYAAIAKSNGYNFDKAAIAAIHAPEPVLLDLAKISREREQNPAAFEFWTEQLANGTVPGVTLKLYPVNIDSNLMAVIECTISNYWDNYVLEGKLLVKEKTAMLVPEVQNEVDSLMKRTEQLMAMKAAAASEIAENNKIVNSMLLGVDAKKLKFTDKHSVDIKTKSELDKEAALSALESRGIDMKTLEEPTAKKDAEKLAAALRELGGNPEADEYLTRSISVKTIRAKLLENEIDPSIYEATSYSFSESRKKAKKSKFEEVVSVWREDLYSRASDSAYNTMQEKSEDPKVSNPSMTM